MLNLCQLNALNCEDFARTIGPVFEHSSWIAEKTWLLRPFESREDLHAALCETVWESDEGAQLALIRAHPDLAGRVVLTSESRDEQASANLGALSPDEAALFNDYNDRYRAKFGFPFVICARLNKKEAILDAFPKRLENSPEEEMETALDEIYKIAELRLQEIIQ